METYQGPVQIMLVANSFKQVVGIENVKLYKMRHNSIATVAIATCCKAALTNHHPKTGHGIPVHPEQCVVSCSTTGVARADCPVRLFSDDWKPSADPKTLPLPPYDGPDYPN